MARYFETSNPEYIDGAMFELPVDLMEKAIEVKDKIVNTKIDNTTAIGKYLTVDPLDEDKDRAIQRVQTYQNKIDSLVDNIINNPDGNYRQGIQQLQREVYEDSTIGHLARINNNKKNFVAWNKDLDSRVEKNPDNFTPEQKALLIKQQREKYASAGGYHNDQIGLRDFDTQDLYGTEPLTDHVKKAFDQKVGKITGIKTDTDTGQLRIITDIKKEGWTEAEILEQLNSYVEARPDLKGYLKQNQELKILPDYQLPAMHLLDYAVKTYKQVVTEDSQTRAMGDIAKAEAIKKLDEPDAIEQVVETVQLTDLTNYQDYDTALDALDGAVKAPEKNISTARAELQALKPDLKGVDKMSFEEVVSNLYADGESQRKALERQSQLKQDAYFAQGTKQYFEKSRAEGKDFVNARGDIYTTTKGSASWKYTATDDKTAKAVQAKVLSGGGDLPISNIAQLNWGVKNKNGVSVLFNTPNSSVFPQGGRTHPTGSVVYTYTGLADPKNPKKGKKSYTVVLTPDRLKQLNITKPLVGETVGMYQKAIATQLGLPQGAIKVGTLVNFGSDVVTPADLAKNNILVGGTETDKNVKVTYDKFGQTTNVEKPYGTTKTTMGGGVNFVADSYAPLEDGSGFSIKATVGQEGKTFNLTVPSDKAGAFTTESANQYIQSKQVSLAFKQRLQRNNITVSETGKVNNFKSAPIQLKVPDYGEGQFEIRSNGEAYFGGRKVTSREEVLLLMDIASKTSTK